MALVAGWLQSGLKPCTCHPPCHPPSPTKAIATHNPALFRSALREAQLAGQDAASVYSLRGLLALRERRIKSALKSMTKAVWLAPKEPQFVFDRSQVSVSQGVQDPEESGTVCEKGLLALK